MRSALLALTLLAGCTIADTALAPAEDVVVVEGLVQLRESFDGQRILVFLHRTVSDGRSLAVPEAEVVVTLGGGREIEIPAASDPAVCVASVPDIVETAGTCHYLEDADGLGFRAGDRLELRVTTGAGEVVEAATTVPGRHRILTSEGRSCWFPPDRPLEVTWTRSEGAWAYFSEAVLEGLAAALEDEGIPVESEPFYLTGLSISASDTTVVYPRQFGLFDRADLDRELALRLQEGTPEGVVSEIAVTALDRNYVNWVRGGNFNPSGQVRVPSVRGDGTGFFGSTVVQRFEMISAPLGNQPGRCLEF